MLTTALCAGWPHPNPNPNPNPSPNPLTRVASRWMRRAASTWRHARIRSATLTLAPALALTNPNPNPTPNPNQDLLGYVGPGGFVDLTNAADVIS